MTLDRPTATLSAIHQLIKSERIDAAHALLVDFLTQHRSDPRGWFLLSTVYLRLRRPSASLQCISQAIRLAPENPSYLIQLGIRLAELGRRDQALAVARSVTASNLTDAAILDSLGTLFLHCDDPARSYQLFTEAVRSQPSNLAFLYNLAITQRMVGEIDGAEAALNRILHAQPHRYAAHYTRAGLRVQSARQNHLDEMFSVLREGASSRRGEMTMCFAIAKELDDLGDYVQSFAYLKRGCAIQKSVMPYDVSVDIARLDRIRRVHTADVVNSPIGFDSERPIFIMGLPRTGTSLVERILSMHSQVRAGGELPTFAVKMVEHVNQAQPDSCVRDVVDRIVDVDPKGLGRAYIAATRLQTDHFLRFTDKNPLNYLHAGIVHRCLPNARIVLVVRDPMDSCYSMLRTLFTGPYLFTYDLGDIGKYFIAWQRLMDHWRQVLGQSLLIVRYEDLVLHQERISRKIVSHCGLEWEEKCLSFHEQSAPITTASAVQVRRRIYSTSIGQWRNYAEQMRPLTKMFEAHGINFSCDVSAPPTSSKASDVVGVSFENRLDNTAHV